VVTTGVMTTIISFQRRDELLCVMVNEGKEFNRNGAGMKMRLVTILLSVAAVHAGDLKSLSVLYVGDGSSVRAERFGSFLRTNVNRFESAARDGFNPSSASGFDVVVLDWPQSVGLLRQTNAQAPIGPREKWTKPTVLLGSAGLNLAVVWKVRGGSG